MARYGPADVTVTYNGNVIPDVTVIGDIPKEMILEEVTPFGVAWEQHASVGVGRVGPITLEAPYSDDATFLRVRADAVGIGGTANLVLLFGGAKTLTVSTIMRSITRTLARGALNRVSVLLQPTGTPTEA
jgi:hypothetical protein